jgi:hypothetical protein
MNNTEKGIQCDTQEVITAAEARARGIKNYNQYDISRIFWEISDAISKGKREAHIPMDHEHLGPRLYKWIDEGAGGYITSEWGEQIKRLLSDLGYTAGPWPFWSRVTGPISEEPRNLFYGQEGVKIRW